MGLTKLKVNAKVKSGRGSADAAAVVDAMTEVWDDIQTSLAKLTPEESEAIKNHFNSFIEGEDDLGDCLFGTSEDFDSRVKFLEDEVQKKYTDELIAQEFIML